MTSVTRDLRNRGMKALAREREQSKEPWLISASAESIPFGMAQQHADELSAERELADAMNLLEASPKLRAMRLRLKVKGKPFDELTLVQRLVVLIDEYDEVINE